MTELLNESLTVYLDCGYTDIKSFWHLTLAELGQIFDAYTRRTNRDRKQYEVDLKQKAIMQRNLALQIGEIVGSMFSKEKRPLTPLSEFYPGLFTKEEESKSKEMSLEAYSALWEDYVWRRNNMKQEGGVMANALERHNIEEAPSRVDRQLPAVADSNGPSPISDQECCEQHPAEPGNS